MSESTICNFAATICRKHENAVYRLALEEKRGAGSNTYTYGGLDYLSDKFASTLQQGGVKQGEVVAVRLSPSAALVVAHLGVLKLGAVVAAIPVQMETSFINQVLQESQPQALVIDEAESTRLASLLDRPNTATIFIVSDYVSKNDFANGYKNFWREINFADADVQIAQTDEASLAYYFFAADKNPQLKKLTVTHDDLLAASQAAASDEDSFGEDELPFQTSKDWAAMEVLTGEIFPVLYRGQCLSTRDFDVKKLSP
ncbi:MAG: AMP-binding protein [Acidobacteria bacterium]|nr:AMP-binding protein [Acidobacteriota bacterium]